MAKNHLLLKVLVCVFVLLFGYFVWPTRYKYLDTPLVIGKLKCPVRVDRITGTTQILFGSEWTTPGQRESN
jgi:hypothetical protein